MMVTYGHPAKDGPGRFIKYDKKEILEYFARVHKDEVRGDKIKQGPAVAFKVKGLLVGIVTAALMCREHNEPLSNIWFDRENKEVWLRISSLTHMDDYITLMDRYSSLDLWTLKEDRFGNELFEHGETIG